MSKEFIYIDDVDQTRHVVLLGLTLLTAWDGEAFVTADYDDLATYAIAMEDVSTLGTYVADFPTEVTTAGVYEYLVLDASYDVIGAGSVTWDGAAEELPATLANQETIIAAIDALSESQTVGNGSVLVNEDYGGASNLAYTTSVGMPIDNAVVRAYLAANYAAGYTGRDYVMAETTTDANGNWVQSMMLDPGSYTFLFFKQGSFGPDTKTVTVS